MSLSTYSIGKIVVEVNDYGEGLLEGTWWEPKDNGKGSNQRKVLPPRVRRHKDALNAQRVQRKRKKRVRQAVMAMQACYLWSMTYKSNMLDYGKAKGDFEEFISRLREIKPEIRAQWVAVAETQTRGAWHWHLALPCYVPKTLFDNLWEEITGDAGWTFVSGPRRQGHVSRPVARVKASLYLSKYFTKEAGESGERYQHAYKVGRGIQVPVERLEFPSLREARAFVESLQQFQYLNNETDWREGGWFCTWTLTG